MCKFIGWDICDTDCSSWGNYGHVKSKVYSSLTHTSDIRNDWFTENNVQKKDDSTNRWFFPTGVFVNENNRNTAQKNIYDVAGNVFEWTTEITQHSEVYAISRGASGADGSIRYATFRHGDRPADTAVSCAVGFRMVLYVE